MTVEKLRVEPLTTSPMQ